MVGQAGLEPAMRNAPDLQSGGVTNFPTDPCGEERLIYTGLSCSFSPEPVVFSITRGPSPYVHNLRVCSISEETQSELRGATPNFWPQLYILIGGLRSTPGIYYQFSRRNDYLQLSPTIQNLILNSIISINPK